jgi:hypothetical protein
MLPRAASLTLLLAIGATLHSEEFTVPPPPVAGPPAPAAGPAGDGADTPEDALAGRRERHDELIDGHAALAGGGIDVQWRRALADAEAAQLAIPTGDNAPRLAVADAESLFEDKGLALDQLLDRMEVEGDVLDALAALKADPALDPDGGKARAAAALRTQMLAALAKQHALQDEAEALRNHAAHVQAEADERDETASKAGEALDALREQLGALSGQQPEPAEAETAPPPADPGADPTRF